MITEENNTLIDLFLDGRLTDDSQPQFESLYRSDTSFRNAVHLQVKLEKSMTKDLLASPYAELLTTKPARRLYLNRFLMATAASLLLLLVGSWWATEHYSDQALATEFHEEVLDDTKASIPSDQDLITEGRKAYFSGNYERAEKLLAEIPEGDPEVFTEAQTLYGYALFQNGKYATAADQLSLLLDRGAPGRSIAGGTESKLRWTRLLAWVGTGTTDDARFRTELDFFLQGDNELYRNKATELNDRLNSGWRWLSW